MHPTRAGVRALQKGHPLLRLLSLLAFPFSRVWRKAREREQSKGEDRAGERKELDGARERQRKPGRARENRRNRRGERALLIDDALILRKLCGFIDARRISEFRSSSLRGGDGGKTEQQGPRKKKKREGGGKEERALG